MPPGSARSQERIAGSTQLQAASSHGGAVDRPGEVVALLSNVSDIVARLASIEQLLEEDDGEEEVDES